jgi:hypothetical protein
MTATRGYIPPTSERSALGVHSLDRFVLAVPDLAPAQRSTISALTCRSGQRWR